MRDFYIPVLAQATQYDRAVGFFSSSMLVEAASGLSGLIRNGGKMRLVIGHPLSEHDWEAVKQGSHLAILKVQLVKDLLQILDQTGGQRSSHALELLSWMVATGSLELKFAFRKVGMYHEKIGIMIDANKNKIVFHGSANESANALLPERNFESLAVYPSWNKVIFEEYGAPFFEGFLDLWENRTPEVLSVEVPSEFYEALLKFRNDKNTPPDLELEQAFADEAAFLLNNQSEKPRLPKVLAGQAYGLRSHQKLALERWAANSYSGIFALATGAGKTITVLHAVTRFVEQGYRVVLIVAVPYQVLAEQWVKVMEHFGMKAIKAFYSTNSWQSTLSDNISQFLADAIPFLGIVVVNDTLASDTFQASLERIPVDRLFFVGDECHHHSNAVWLNRIPSNAKFRIGLSATPWNPGQLVNKEHLEKIYGPVVSNYSLQDALRDDVLCPYAYNCVPCNFDDDEADEYERLTLKINSLIAQDPHRENQAIKLQIQIHASRRSRLIGSLRDKLRQLSNMLLHYGRHPHTLIYCGEGKHPLDSDSTNQENNINLIASNLAKADWKVGRITATESMNQRENILQSFDEGFIEAIVAMRVLDEGFDIPSCRTAFILASNNSYRQYVQRRGRVLRKAHGKIHADIIDFVALPSTTQIANNAVVWRKQAEAELARVRDFINLASNSEAQQLIINKILVDRGLGAIYYSNAVINEDELYEY
jgi:superfamily II DNA or RNA helicase